VTTTQDLQIEGSVSNLTDLNTGKKRKSRRKEREKVKKGGNKQKTEA
jgi:hypothetical protein